MPPTMRDQQRGEQRRPHLHVVAGDPPAARPLRDAADVQVGALQAVGDDRGRRQRQRRLRHPPAERRRRSPAAATDRCRARPAATSSCCRSWPGRARGRSPAPVTTRTGRGQRRTASARTGRARRCDQPVDAEHRTSTALSTTRRRRLTTAAPRSCRGTASTRSSPCAAGRAGTPRRSPWPARSVTLPGIGGSSGLTSHVDQRRPGVRQRLA